MNKSKLPKSEFDFIKLLFFKIEKYKLSAFALTLIIGQALYVSLPGILGILINSVLGKDNWNLSWLFLFPIVWSLSHIFIAFSRFLISLITQDIRKISKETIFRYLICLSNNVYTNKGAGEVESFMQEISFNSRYMFAESFPFFIRILVSIIVSILILSYNSLWFGALFTMWLVLYIPISYQMAKGATHHVSESLKSSSKVSALTVDIIENHELIPSFGTEKYEIGKFQKLLDNERKAYIDAQLSIDKADLWQHFLQLLLPFAIVFFIVFTQGDYEFSPGEVAALFTLSLIVTAQIRDFGRGILGFFEVKERMKIALQQLSAFEKHSKMNLNIGSKVPNSYSIKLDNVSFSYDTNLTALHNVTLAIQENEKIGIIGYSGAGKSTLMKILRGYYCATSGDVYFGGISLKEIEPKFLAENISEVSQTLPLFHRSLRENVSYGCKEVTDEKIWEILERAQLAEYVRKLPNGLDTVIGVKGNKLSGGEKTRLAIARAFLRNSKVVILDEATASLDSESESLLQIGLKELMSNRTVIAIAHRLSTLRSMDRIVMFEKGQIVANGPHDELLETNKSYKKLWEMQVLI